MADNLAYRCSQRQVVTIDVLPDDVLLAIFDFHVFKDQDDILQVVLATADEIQSWKLLVHVCRRWRCLVFGSPRRLNLQVHYDPGASTRTLDVWPSLPVLISGWVDPRHPDNVIAGLKHTDRIRQIALYRVKFSISQLVIEKLLTAMQVPFPELTILRLSFKDQPYVVLPDSFLSGSAPRLRFLQLNSTPFPGLPNLLSSTTHLVYLYLFDIPHSGYISPEAMATCLSALTSLEKLGLRFKSPQSSPEQENRRSPPPTRSILPALTFFWFQGVNEYLDALVARIDTPRLSRFLATFFNDIDFDTPELIQFVSRPPALKAPNEAHVLFDSQTASVELQPPASYDKYFKVEISCREPGWQLSSLAQICTTSLPLLSKMENLLIYEPMDARLDWKEGIANIDWLELLLPFTAVKSLYLSKQFAPRVASALQETSGGGATEVLSSLQNLYLEGFEPSESVDEVIERFISARQLTDHPVAVSVWDRIGRDDSESEESNSSNKQKDLIS